MKIFFLFTQNEKDMNVQQQISGLAFATNGHFCDPIKFASKLIDLFDIDGEGIVSNKLQLIEIIQGIISIEIKPPFDNNKALKFLLQEDIKPLLSILNEIDESIIEEKSIEHSFGSLLEIAKSYNLKLGRVELRIVDSFPEPYQNNSFAAMTFDNVDKKMFGITPGVALKRSELRPLYSIALLAHEFTHLIIGRIDTKILARGFEEGVADYIGGLKFAGKIIGDKLAEQILWNSRNRYGRNQLGRLYRHSLIQVMNLVQIAGEECLFNYLKDANNYGRRVIKNIEELLIDGQIKELKYYEKTSRSIQNKFNCRFINMTPDLVVSPLSFVLSCRFQIGDNINKLISQYCMNFEDGNVALDELQNRIYLIIQDDGKIVCDETKLYIKNKHLRYEI